MNCHIVAQSLTAPWEDKQRELHYYDFKLDKVLRCPSKKLFAEEDAIKPEYEEKLSKLIERPIGMYKAMVQKGSQASTDKWNVYRALFLYFLVQSTRFSAYLNLDKKIADHASDLEKTLDIQEEYLNAVVAEHMKTHDLAVLKVPDGSVLFFPESGFYMLPVQDTGCLTKFSFTFAVPLFINVALAIIPKTMDPAFTQTFQNQLPHYSTGLNENCNRVVIPSTIMGCNPIEEIISSIKGQRALCVQTVEAINKYRELVPQMYKMMGLTIELKSGRYLLA